MNHRLATIPDPAAELTEDAFLDGRLRLRQPRRGHRAGHDAMLLAANAIAQPRQRVVEFGAGVGAAGLALARLVPDIDLVLVEIDEALAELARVNAELNGIAAQILALDVAAPPTVFLEAGLPPGSADAVIMNPPFNAASRHQSSPDTGRAIAHIDAGETLATWVHAARRLLRPKGVLSLIWRAEGLKDVLDALERGFGELVVIPVHPDPKAAAIRILVQATKGSRAPMSLRPGLVLGPAAERPAQGGTVLKKPAG